MDDTVELRDASHLWGKDPIEARNIVRQEEGDKRICAVGIGVAGENCSRIACIQGDAYHTHGGFGCGGVMGSKNLKLIAVRGHGSIEVADAEKFKETVDDFWATRMALATNHWWEGNVGGYNIPLENAAYYPPWRSRNGQWRGVTRSIKDVEKFDHKVFDDRGYTGRRYGCRHCAKSNHGTFYKVTDGPNAGVKCKWIMTCLSTDFLKILDPVPETAAEDVIRYVFSGDSLGFEDGQISSTISWAFECYQRGLLTKDDTGGIKLNWPGDKGPKNNDLIFQVMEAAAHRDGDLGELLADGAFAACKKLLEKDGGVPRLSDEGKPPEYYVLGTKRGGVHYEDDLNNKAKLNPDGSLKFRIKWDFQTRVAERGGKHSNYYGFGPDTSTMTPGEIANMKNQYAYEESGRYYSYTAWAKELCDAFGICMHIKFTNDELATTLNYATGSHYTGDSLILAGRRNFNIAKAINTIRCGFTREHDEPRERVLVDLPPPSLPGHLDMDKWNEQLDNYYEFHGWDIESGWQKKETLLELGLPGVAWALWREGKLK